MLVNEFIFSFEIRPGLGRERRAVTYLEYVPCEALRPYVRFLWRLKGSGDPNRPERIVPDGSAEIVINSGDVFTRLHANGHSHAQPEILLVGQITRALHLAAGSLVDVLGIRFRPEGLRAFVGVAMRETVENDIRLHDANRELARRLDATRCNGSDCSTLAACESALLSSILERSSARAARRLLHQASMLLEDPRIGVESAAGMTGVGRRTLERLFHSEIGLSPKLYQRLRRLQRALRLKEREPARMWAAIAAAAGYSDQPHLVREFRSIVGLSPEQFVRARTAMSGFFSG
jgi:AraC-like DNA-binding protein